MEQRGARRIAAALAAQLAGILPEQFDEPITLALILSALNNGTQAVRTALYQTIEEAARLGVTTAGETLAASMGGLEIDYTLVNTAARDWARQYAGQLITGIDETTRRQVAQAVGEWIDSGDPLPALTRRLQALRDPMGAGVFSRSRAEMIATTETTRAYAQGNIQAWRASGVVAGQAWLTANDERVCPICAPMGGLVFTDDGARPASLDQQMNERQTTGLGEMFTHPGGGGTAARFAGLPFEPPAHPRCRCRLVPVLST